MKRRINLLWAEVADAISIDDLYWEFSVCSLTRLLIWLFTNKLSYYFQNMWCVTYGSCLTEMKSEKWQPLRLQTNPETEFRFSHKLAHNYIFTTAGFEERSGDQGLELSLERSGLIPLETVQGDTERGCQDLSHTKSWIKLCLILKKVSILGRGRGMLQTHNLGEFRNRCVRVKLTACSRSVLAVRSSRCKQPFWIITEQAM